MNAALLALDDARLSLKIGDPVAAVAILNTIISDPADLPVFIVEDAIGLEPEAQAQLQAAP